MKIVVIGAGGHSKVIKDMILSDPKNQIVSYLDDRYRELTLVEAIYFGPISSGRKIISYFSDLRFIIAIGNNQTRKHIAQRLDLVDEAYATLIHPSATVSPSAKIGSGTVVMAHSVINADAQIGNHTIINTGAIVEHDNQLDDFVHVSPGATLTGSVKLGEGSHVGAGATVIPDVEIGKWSVVGAGATVTRNIPIGCTAVGVPARVIAKRAIGGV